MSSYNIDESGDHSKQDNGGEDLRLGGHTPLKTIIKLVPGPLISQIVNQLYGVIDSMWVSKFIGELGLTALAISYVIETTAISFGSFILTAASTQIAFLLSSKEYDKINQLSVDLFRICIILGIIIPAILLPVSKPLFAFLGADKQIQSMAFDYVIPLASMNIVTCVYQCICGILQAEGRTWTFGISQIISMIRNMALMDPLLLYLLKRTLGSSLATEFSMLLPAFVLGILLYMKKFTTRPRFNLFAKKFIKETWEASKAGLSSFIMSISIVVPNFVMQKYMSIRA